MSDNTLMGTWMTVRRRVFGDLLILSIYKDVHMRLESGRNGFERLRVGIRCCIQHFLELNLCYHQTPMMGQESLRG